MLIAEIYSRDGLKNAHAEKSGDSYPESIEKLSSNCKVCLIKESEGGATLQNKVEREKPRISIH